MGRHKIPMMTIEKKHERHICFSKRRKGLFSKAKKLARAGSEVAIIVFSSAGNVFTFGHPSIESVADRFLGQEHNRDRSSEDDMFRGNAGTVARGSDAGSGGLARPFRGGESSTKGDTVDGGDTIMQDKGLESDHEGDDLESETSSEAEGSEEEHAAMHDGEHATGGETSTEETLDSGRFWWNNRIDNLELHELVEFESALVELQEKVRNRANQILVEKPVMGHYFDFSNYEFRYPE